MRKRWVAGACLAMTMVAAGCGSAGRGISGAEQSRLCSGTRVAAKQLAAEHPELDAAAVQGMAEQTCRTGFHKVAQTGPPPIAASSVGCDRAGDEPAAPVSHRRVAAPDPRTPYFAPRAGVLPATGTPTVAGIALPQGSRCPHFWATDAPTPDALVLAQRLAAAFPQTGLWPVIWDSTDRPEGYMVSAGRPSAADGHDAGAVLAHVWATRRNDGTRFPGLAAGSRTPDAAPVDAFGTLGESQVLMSPPASGWVLLLVPVNRPADAISMLGFAQTEVMPDAELTAVARSWEERFGAVLALAGSGSFGFAVSDPPRTRAQAVALAAEQDAFAEDEDSADEAELAERLLEGAPSPAVSRWRGFWNFGWPD